MKNTHPLIFIKRLLILLVIVAIAAPLFSFRSTKAQEETSVLTIDLDPQFAVDWMQLLYDSIQREEVSAPAAARVYAYAGVTLYESVVHGIPGNNSLSWQLTDMPDMPYPNEGEIYDWATVANTALPIVMKFLLPNASDETLQAIADMEASQLAAREQEVDRAVVQRSAAYGDGLGQAMTDWISEDHFVETREMTFEMPTGDPSYWVPTAENMHSVEPYWGQIRPFVLEYVDECAVPLDMPYNADENSAFYPQAVEVMETGNNLTDEQKQIAEFWVDTPGQTGTPAGHWVLIENQLVDQLNLDLERTSEMYAMVGVALADAFISSWSLKYQVLLLRPASYIQQNMQQSWDTYVKSPGFPSYPSEHSVVSAAAAEMLTDLFGTVVFTDASATSRDYAPRYFTSFRAAASEAAISRLYGGIHYRVDIENGMIQGVCVGRRVANTLELNPIRQGE